MSNMTLAEVIADIESLGYNDQRSQWLDSLRGIHTMLNTEHDESHSGRFEYAEEFPEWVKALEANIDLGMLKFNKGFLSNEIDGVEYSLVEWDEYISLIALREQINTPASDDAEAAAKAIYNILDGSAQYPWINRGNSLKQDEARRYAKVAIAALKPDVTEVESNKASDNNDADTKINSYDLVSYPLKNSFNMEVRKGGDWFRREDVEHLVAVTEKILYTAKDFKTYMVERKLPYRQAITHEIWMAEFQIESFKKAK